MRGVLEAPQTVQRSSNEERLLVVAGLIFPGLVIAPLIAASFRAGDDLASAHSEPALTVEVAGHQFWWEVRYPEHQVASANEIHIPAGQPVRVRLSTSDVIHSFWVPELHGKLDMIPGRVHELRIEATRPGVFRGQCAEFCGIQHALMALEVIAHEPTEFAKWLAGRRTTRRDDDVSRSAQRGAQVFVQSGCGLCHRVEGRVAATPTGEAGPDLGDLAQRRRLAAATLANTRENLRAFIRSPEAVKPGVRMPPSPDLTDAALNDLIDYLLTLPAGGAPP